MPAARKKAKKVRASSLTSLSSVTTNKDESIFVADEELNRNQIDFKKEIMRHISKISEVLKRGSSNVNTFQSDVPKLVDKYLEEIDLNLTVEEVLDGMNERIVGVFMAIVAELKTEMNLLKAEVQQDIEDYCRSEDTNPAVHDLLKDFSGKISPRFTAQEGKLLGIAENMRREVHMFKNTKPRYVLKSKIADILASQEGAIEGKHSSPIPVEEVPAPKRGRPAKPKIEVVPPTAERARPTRRAAAVRTPSVDSTFRRPLTSIGVTRSASVQGRVPETPAIVPKFDPSAPHTAIPKRVPRPGELVLSLSGSPLMSAQDLIQMATTARGGRSRNIRQQIDMEEYQRQLLEVLGDTSIFAGGPYGTSAAPKPRATGRKK